MNQIIIKKQNKMINLKGYRTITVENKIFKYKCVSHEKTIVADEFGNFLTELYAHNSGEVNQMSLPSLVIEKLKQDKLI